MHKKYSEIEEDYWWISPVKKRKTIPRMHNSDFFTSMESAFANLTPQSFLKSCAILEKQALFRRVEQKNTTLNLPMIPKNISLFKTT